MNDPINCSTAVDLSANERKHCLGFTVDMTRSMESEDISHVEVVKNFIANEKTSLLFALFCSMTMVLLNGHLKDLLVVIHIKLLTHRFGFL